jgi:hypothetical protein
MPKTRLDPAITEAVWLLDKCMDYTMKNSLKSVAVASIEFRLI